MVLHVDVWALSMEAATFVWKLQPSSFLSPLADNKQTSLLSLIGGVKSNL